MEEKNGKSPVLALTVATVVFAALGVMVYNQTPYKGVRPSVPEMREPSEQIRARLWQDPFQAVLDCVKAREARQKQDKVAPNPDDNKSSNKKTSNKEKQKAREAWQKQDKATRKLDDTKSSDKKTSNQEKQIEPDPIVAGVIDFNGTCTLTETLNKNIQEGQDKGEVTVLATMVFGGPYAELVESRLRQRYAVISALKILKFYPEDPEHIGCFKIINKRDGQDASLQCDQEFTLENIIPFEWFASENHKERVLILWLNEDIFEKPLSDLLCLRKIMQDYFKKLHFKIIGPPSSTTLLEMIKELDNFKSMFPCGTEIYCATATADDSFLLPNFKKGNMGVSKQRHEAKKIILSKFEDKGIVFNRIIRSDGELLEELINELDYRDVDLINTKPTPFQRICGRSSLLLKSLRVIEKKFACGENRDHVVLMSEWDTEYGRLLPKTFLEVIKEKHNKIFKEKNIQVEDIKWVHHFSYLRGVDGKLPGEQDENAKGKAKKDEGSSKKDDDLKKLEEPVGKSQYDYLRRLAENICRLDDKLSREGKGSIKAIGVLGNDFYDKYLVLQALGQRFPERIFFTTDLDANYLHPANLQWTRNLVVASTFDLQLHEDHQSGVPPFRDSYQTSVFAATLRAFNHLGPGDFKELKPRVFEIGRRNAIDLTGRSHKPAPINQALPVKGFPNIGWVYFIFMIVVLSILSMVLYLSCTSETTITNSVKDFFGRTLELSFGKKPSQVRIIFIWLISFALIFLVVIGYYLVIINNSTEEPLHLAEGISIWPTVFIRLVAVLLAIIFFLYSYIKLQNNKNDITKNFCLIKNKNNLILNTANTNNNIINVNKEWENYVNCSNINKRVVWIIFITLLYFIFCGLIIGIFGFPISPVRGIWSGWIDFVVLISAVLLFLFLTFFVLDTTMMFRRFVRRFSNKQPQWHFYSRDFFLEKWIKDPELSKWIRSKAEEALSDWMLIQLIAKRTEVVGKLIYFPFIVWILLIVSRLYFFDNWRTPPGLALVIFMGALLAWSCAVILRRTAEKLKADMLDRLAQQSVGAYSAEPPNKDDGDRIQYILKEIKSIRKGAFAPFFQQPALQSLLASFAGIGGVNLLDFLM